MELFQAGSVDLALFYITDFNTTALYTHCKHGVSKPWYEVSDCNFVSYIR